MTKASVDFGEFVMICGTFLVLTVASSRLATLVKKVGLPVISGYLLVGVLCGRFGLNVLKGHQVPVLYFVSQCALAYIAFSAGSELYVPELRALFSRILAMGTTNSFITLGVCTTVIASMGVSGVIPFMQPLETGCIITISMVAGSIMICSSPASAIAVVKEQRAKGPFTSSLLALTICGDVFVVIIFTVSLSFAEIACFGRDFDIWAIVGLVCSLICALLYGIIVGYILILLLWLPKYGIPAPYVMIPLGYFVFWSSEEFTELSLHLFDLALNLEPLLICIIAGAVAINKSKNRSRFLKFLKKVGPYVFVPFFTIAGAAIDLKVMFASFGFALVIVLSRVTGFFLGTASGALLMGAPKQHALHMFMAMLTQAGVSMGLCAEAAISLKEIGPSFQSTLMSIIIINQLIGPTFCKLALRRVGEAGAVKDKGGDEEDEQRHAIIIGCDASNISAGLMSRLYYDNWAVHMVVGDAETKFSLDAQIRTLDDRKHEAEELSKQRTQMAKGVDGSVLSSAHEPPTLQLDMDAAPAVGNELGVETYAMRGLNLEDHDPEAPNLLLAMTDKVKSAALKSINNTLIRRISAPAHQEHHDEHEHIKGVVDTVLAPSNNVHDLIRAAQGILDRHGKQVMVIASMLDSDSDNFSVVSALPETKGSLKVFSVVHNTAWNELFLARKCFSIFAYSSALQVISRVIDTPMSQPVDLLSGPLNFDNYSSVILPTEPILPTDDARQMYLDSHPGPTPKDVRQAQALRQARMERDRKDMDFQFKEKTEKMGLLQEDTYTIEDDYSQDINPDTFITK